MASGVRSTHPVLEVNLDAIRANYRTMRSLVGRRVATAAVVKSNAYGLGLAAIAQSLAESGCEFFFVANLEEALLLRSYCPDVSIAVLCDEFPKMTATYRAKTLIPVLNTVEDVDALYGSTPPLPHMLHVDTGFSRFGLRFKDIRRLYLSGIFAKRPMLGLISHLACSDAFDDATNALQRNRFIAISELLQAEIRSLSASAGVWLGAPYHFDMVRIGSALFGLNNAGVTPSPLAPVVRLSARIVDLKEVPRREAVGYGATFRTSRTTRLGVAAIGYTHGLPWACANKIAARIGQFSAPIIGRISMEYITIDLTDVPEAVCGRGSWIDILNDDFGADDLAVAAGVNAQEILTRLGAGCALHHTPNPDTNIFEFQSRMVNSSRLSAVEAVQ